MPSLTVRRLAALVVSVVLLILAAPAHATFIININQVGSNVVATGSGTIDLTDLSSSAPSSNNAFINADFAALVLGSPSLSADTVYSGVSGPAAFGSGGFTIASSGSG